MHIRPHENPLPYFGEPVGVGDWDVIDAIVSAAAIPVENGGEVRKIAIEVKILSVGPSTDPTVHQVTLKHSRSNNRECDV